MKTLRNKWTVPLASAFVAALVVSAAWFQFRPEAPEPEEVAFTVRHTDFVDIASDLDALTDLADTIVMGTVGEVTWSGIDRGDGTERRLEFPATLYKVNVQEALKGQVDDSIYVYRTDPEFFPDQPLTKLKLEELVVLYLNRMEALPPADAYTEVVYVPIALDNGVFDVLADGAVGVVSEDTVVRPRGIAPDMFAEGTEFTAAQIRQAIDPEGETGPVGNTN